MKKSKLKIVIGFLAVLAVMVVGTIYYVSTKISSDDIRKIALENIEKVLPGAQVELGKIDLSFGTSVKLNINKFNLKLKKRRRAGNELFSLKELSVKVPIWAIITGGGTIELKIVKPAAGYAEYKKGNNWELALAGGKAKGRKRVKGESATSTTASSGDGAVLPSFLAKSRVNIKFVEINVNYQLKNGMRGNLAINRFLIKNLNLEKSSAFELASNFSTKLNKKDKVSLEVLVVGELGLHNFIKNKNLDGSVLVKLKNIVLPQIAKPIPLIKLDLNFNVNPSQEVSGQFKTEIIDTSKIDAKFQVSKKEVLISDLLVSLHLNDLIKQVGQNIPLVTLGKTRLEVKGEVKFLTKNSKVYPKLNFTLAPPLKINAPNNLSLSTSLEGYFKNKKLFTKVKSNIFGGTLATTINAVFDPNSKNFDVKNLGPFKVEIAARNLNIERGFIQQSIYGSSATKKKKKTNKSAAVSASAKKVRPPPSPALLLPKVDFGFIWADIKIGKQKFNGAIKLDIRGNKVKSKGFNFKYSNGEGDINFKVALLKNSGIDSSFKMDVKNLNLNSFRPFLPPMLDNLSGTLNSKVSGSVGFYPYRDLLKHNVKVSVKARTGQLKGINISEHISSVLASIPMAQGKLGKKKVKVSEEFEIFNLKGTFKEDHYQLRDIQYVGLKNSINIKGNGNLYPLTKKRKGLLDFTFTDNAGLVPANVIEQIGTKTIPIRLKGTQFDLKPDYGYTISKLAKNMYKKRGKKMAKKAAKKIIAKKAKNLLKNDAAKKLFKGLFK